MLFSDEILDYAGKKIGNIGILVAIAANFSNPGVTLSYLFKKFGKNASSLPPQHPSITLVELGLDKEKTAKLIRDVDMILNPDFKTTPSTAFTRKPTKQPFVNHYRFDRPLVPYGGEYIEGDDDKDEYPPTKQRKYHH
uniref:Uncharacterized protein n=1 Tax=Panagrolaimus davidi TaxID=227884 RepID=A0A914Q8D2_9BILA